MSEIIQNANIANFTGLGLKTELGDNVLYQFTKIVLNYLIPSPRKYVPKVT